MNKIFRVNHKIVFQNTIHTKCINVIIYSICLSIILLPLPLFSLSLFRSYSRIINEKGCDHVKENIILFWNVIIWCPYNNITLWSHCYKSKEGGKDHEPIQSSITSDAKHCTLNWQKHRKTLHTIELRSHPFPKWWSQGCKKHAW